MNNAGLLFLFLVFCFLMLVSCLIGFPWILIFYYDIDSSISQLAVGFHHDKAVCFIPILKTFLLGLSVEFSNSNEMIILFLFCLSHECDAFLA